MNIEMDASVGMMVVLLLFITMIFVRAESIAFYTIASYSAIVSAYLIIMVLMGKILRKV